MTRRSRLIIGCALLFLVLGVIRTNAQGPTHTVQPGENLFRIALRYGTTVEALAAANHIADPTQITVGQVLIVPGGDASSQPAAQQPSAAQVVSPTDNPPAPAQAAPASPVYYIVQQGDTLANVARKFGVTWVDLATANHMDNANLISPGQQLIVPGVAAPGDGATVPSVPADNAPAVAPAIVPTIAPPPTTVPTVAPAPTNPPAQPQTISNTPSTYVVQPGEGLAAIGRKFNVSWPLLAEANNLTDPNTIYPGMTLKIPSTDTTAAPPTTMEMSVGVPPGPPPAGSTGKIIKVILHEERVYAYENGVLVHTTLASTGLPGTPTVQGDFKIYAKYTAQLMTGPGYYLPGVPWVMYFYEGYSLHGTYWHHNWGHPMSHGCVNLPTDDALWYYTWADVGTPVHVEW